MEIGCGFGEASIYFASQGANVTATDLSSGMVALVEQVAKLHGIKLRTVVCAADQLPFEDQEFDMVYAANVLHHVDMEPTLREIKRVLKPDGLFVAWDPVKYNPAINVYRALTQGATRTEDEHPIDKNYLKLIQKYFSSIKTKGFWLFANMVFVKYFFVDHLNPRKVRYWKYVVSDEERIKPFYFKMERIDRKMLRKFPKMKWMCWNMVVIAKNEQ